MQDRFDSPGRTRWRRFAAMMMPAAAVAGAILFGMTNGAIAASFAVSGQTFKTSASELRGKGFVQFGGAAQEIDGTKHPVAVTGIRDAQIFDLCQSVKAPGAPVVLTITAGGDGRPATASDLLIDVESLEGDTTFGNINIGQDASTLKGGPDGAKGDPKAFGQQADSVTIRNLRQVARSTHAGTFNLTGLRLKVNAGAAAKECF
ncbi:hypothetical protein GA0070624_3557 [Micromonospora rhizosphaerae]|uniref:Cholesterol esterase n=1 Tax=Micromonospora rhizosphaerae TaxID=568872 RepID=A0A1C6SE64_9ACTN|nr:DUF6230 family protein [Micromonospora rhizosphaerae]SCL27717.1 hypothetical protein GA0070624_3557 [Micromonospora rhizosphaerae]